MAALMRSLGSLNMPKKQWKLGLKIVGSYHIIPVIKGSCFIDDQQSSCTDVSSSLSLFLKKDLSTSGVINASQTYLVCSF
jgi:hypothetical protein